VRQKKGVHEKYAMHSTPGSPFSSKLQKCYTERDTKKWKSPNSCIIILWKLFTYFFLQYKVSLIKDGYL